MLNRTVGFDRLKFILYVQYRYLLVSTMSFLTGPVRYQAVYLWLLVPVFTLTTYSTRIVLVVTHAWHWRWYHRVGLHLRCGNWENVKKVDQP